jgi:alginate O-acetyltransferase complex protein AlgI
MAAAVTSQRSTSLPAAISWLPLVALPAAVVAFSQTWQPWVCFWALTASIYGGMKWLTFAECKQARQAPRRDALGYLLFWPGMNADAFLEPARRARVAAVTEWVAAGTKLLLGLGLIAISSRPALAAHPELAGGIGLIGIALSLLFGFFHLLSLQWTRGGFEAPPIMRSPFRAASLAEYWGQRWNLAFRDVAHAWIFRPLLRRTSAAAAVMGVFVISGLIHDLVISVASKARWGQPTLYFILQGLGILLEKSRAGVRAGLGHGVRGRLFCAAAVIGPAVLLFHPPFLNRVVVPTVNAVFR